MRKGSQVRYPVRSNLPMQISHPVFALICAPHYAIIARVDIVIIRGGRSSEESAVALLLLDDGVLCSLSTRTTSYDLWLLSLITPIIGDNGIDCLLEDLIDTTHLLAATLHVSCSHLARNVEALFLCNGSQSLGLEKIDTGALVS